MRPLSSRSSRSNANLRALALVATLAAGCSGAAGEPSSTTSATPSGGMVCAGADGTVSGGGGDVQLRICATWTCQQIAARSDGSVTCTTPQPPTTPIPPGGYGCAANQGGLYCPPGGQGGGWICVADESQLTCTPSGSGGGGTGPGGSDCVPGTEGCPATGSGGSDCVPGTEGCPATGSGGSDCVPGTEGCPATGSGGSGGGAETGTGGRGSGTGGDTGAGGSGGSGGHCTFTQGYWKNHPDAWPVTSLTIGGVSYAESDLLDIFGMDPAGDASLILAHQLIAALLNQAAAANPPAAVTQALGAAQVWMAANKDADGRLAYGTPAGTPAAAQATALSSTLDSFNNGLGGVPHCP